MNCQLFEQHYLDELDGLLDAPLAAALHAHKDGCTACQELYETARDGLALARRYMPVHEPPAALDQRIMAAAQDALVKRSSQKLSDKTEGGFFAWLNTLFASPSFRPALAFCAVAMLVGSVYVFQAGQGGSLLTGKRNKGVQQLQGIAPSRVRPKARAADKRFRRSARAYKKKDNWAPGQGSSAPVEAGKENKHTKKGKAGFSGDDAPIAPAPVARRVIPRFRRRPRRRVRRRRSRRRARRRVKRRMKPRRIARSRARRKRRAWGKRGTRRGGYARVRRLPPPRRRSPRRARRKRRKSVAAKPTALLRRRALKRPAPVRWRRGAAFGVAGGRMDDSSTRTGTKIRGGGGALRAKSKKRAKRGATPFATPPPPMRREVHRVAPAAPKPAAPPAAAPRVAAAPQPRYRAQPKSKAANARHMGAAAGAAPAKKGTVGALRGNTSRYTSHIVRGRNAARQGNTSGAIYQYKRALAYARPHQRAALYLRIGQLYLRRNDLQGARRHFDKAVQATPASRRHLTYERITRLYKWHGKYQNAAKMLRRLKKLYPNRARQYDKALRQLPNPRP